MKQNWIDMQNCRNTFQHLSVLCNSRAFVAVEERENESRWGGLLAGALISFLRM